MPKPDRLPGFNCPVCNFFIELPMQRLLNDESYTCPKCGETFSMSKGGIDQKPIMGDGDIGGK